MHPPNRGGLAVIGLEQWLSNVYRIGDFFRPKPGDIIVDVGAHVGLFTLRVLAEEPRCRVIALEPSKENFEFLCRNLAATGRDYEQMAFPYGIAADFGRIWAQVPTTNRSFDTRTVPAPESERNASQAVPLAFLVGLAGNQDIALLKIDAEGGEFEAFSTVDEATVQRIQRLAMEYHDNLAPGTLALLREKLAATHQLSVFPDPGQLHGRLFAVRHDLVQTSPSTRATTDMRGTRPCYLAGPQLGSR